MAGVMGSVAESVRRFKTVLEERARRKKKKQIRITRWQRAILLSVGAAGALSVALCAPNAFKIAAPFLKKLMSANRQAITRARERLIRNGLLKRDAAGKFLELTLKGRAFLRRIEFRAYTIPKPKRWDERWRILIFDISEKRRELRDKLRELLLILGFKRVQYSVWVHPYPCEDFVALLKADWQLGKSLLYLIVDELENDAALRRHFGLAEPPGTT